MSKSKNVLVILGHPNKNSFCGSIAQQYMAGLKLTKHQCQYLALADLTFDIGSISHDDLLEPDLKKAQDLIKWANHLVFIYPIWWGGMPALFKGFIDRTIAPNFAFKYTKNGKWDKLLTGKTAHVISTMDTPIWIFKWFYGSAANKQIKNTILQFCGVNPVTISNFGSVKQSSIEQRKEWLEQAFKFGIQL